MLKKLSRISLFWFLLFGLNISAGEDQDEAKVGIEIRDGKIWIRAESSKGIRIVTEPAIDVQNLREREKKILEQSWARYPEDTACKWLHDCREICKDIYNNRRDRLFCGEFPETQVKKLDEIDAHLGSFNAQILDDYVGDDLEVLVTIDPDRLKHHVERFSMREKRIFLAWMAKNDKVVNSFENADDGDLSEELLEAVKVEGEGLAEAFTKEIYDGKSFMEMALVFKEDGGVDYMDVAALGWMEDVFENRCYDQEDFDNTNEENSLCEFKKGYCQLGLTEAQWEALLTPWQDFLTGVLHSTVKIILDNFTPDTPPAWWTEGMAPGNLGATEMNALCEMDLVKKEE